MHFENMCTAPKYVAVVGTWFMCDRYVYVIHFCNILTMMCRISDYLLLGRVHRLRF